MRCPRCRCEVGERKVCPFCGATVDPGYTNWNMAGPSRTTQTVPSGRVPREGNRAVERKLRELVTKVDLLLVIQIGSILLNILALVLIALK